MFALLNPRLITWSTRRLNQTWGHSQKPGDRSAPQVNQTVEVKVAGEKAKREDAGARTLICLEGGRWVVFQEISATVNWFSENSFCIPSAREWGTR